MQINKKDMTATLANKYLRYSKYTGYLYRKYKYHNNVVKDKRACRPCNNQTQQHLDVTLCGRNYPAHRIIWLMVYGKFPERHIDHINHIETDNTLINLREVSQYENNRNNSKRKDNTTGVVGVWVSKVNGNKKYIAEIRDLNKKKITKSFYTLKEAKSQRKQWEKLYNYHRNHGIVKPL